MIYIPNSPGIYKIVNSITGKVYVGSAMRLSNRWAVHKNGLMNGKHHSTKLQRSWNKHGCGVFQFVVIELIDDKSCLIEREQYWIDCLDAVDSGYNENPTAGSSTGRKFRTETIEKMSHSRKGKRHSEKTKALMSMQRKGIKKSLEHREKIRAGNIGKVISQETRAKMSAAAKLRASRKRDELGRFYSAQRDDGNNT